MSRRLKSIRVVLGLLLVISLFLPSAFAFAEDNSSKAKTEDKVVRKTKPLGPPVKNAPKRITTTNFQTSSGEAQNLLSRGGSTVTAETITFTNDYSYYTSVSLLFYRNGTQINNCVDSGIAAWFAGYDSRCIRYASGSGSWRNDSYHQLNNENNQYVDSTNLTTTL